MDADETFALALADCQGFLRSVVRRLCPERSAIDDLVQEANLRAWKHRASFKVGSDIRAWLWVVARHAAIDYCRSSRGRHRRHEQLDGVDVPGRQVTGPLTAEKLELLIRAGDVLDDQQRRWILSLPANTRAMILAEATSGATYDELAAAFGMPVGTFKSRLHRVCERAPRA